MRNRAAISFVTAALWIAQALAQTPAPISNTDLSKETENPVTRQITLPLRYEGDFQDGAYDATKDTFEIDQAVVPFRLNEDWALITRTKLPLESLPPKKLGEHWTFGLSNGYTTFFLSPEHGQGFYWGAGPVLYYPTATNPALGVNKWGSGPSAAFLHQDASPWVFGAVVNNIWSFGGPTTGSDRTKPALLKSDRQLSFRRWLVGRLVARNHHELDRERREMDRPGRRGLRQAVSSGKTGREGRSGQLLQRGPTPGQQRNVADSAQAHLCVSGSRRHEF